MTNLINVRKEFEALSSNWIDDEEKHYSEYCHYITESDEYKNCEYHKKLLKGEIEPSDIPSSKLADGYDYTHIRRLQDYFDSSASTNKPERFTVELADILIRIADLCGEFNLDLEDALKTKMEYNKTRPYRHGNKVV